MFIKLLCCSFFSCKNWVCVYQITLQITVRKFYASVCLNRWLSIECGEYLVECPIHIGPITFHLCSLYLFIILPMCAFFLESCSELFCASFLTKNTSNKNRIQWWVSACIPSSLLKFSRIAMETVWHKIKTWMLCNKLKFSPNLGWKNPIIKDFLLHH